MINIAGWDWDAYLQHLEDIKIERRRWRDYMIEELYPLPRKYSIFKDSEKRYDSDFRKDEFF